MLVLTRKPQEDIRIGDDITIKVLRMNSCEVALGIDAPKNIPVHRQEVYERLNRVVNYDAA